MVKTIIAREHVEQYIRNSMEPVSFTKLVDEFTYPSTREDRLNNLKAHLENILNTAIDSGSILQYKDHLLIFAWRFGMRRSIYGRTNNLSLKSIYLYPQINCNFKRNV